MSARNLFRKIVQIGSGVVVILFIGIQFIGPNIDNPPVMGEVAVPPEVKNIFERSCYDCHSNKTQLKWFDKIAPVRWLVADDVSRARKGLNFTNWDKLKPDLQKVALWEAYQYMSLGAMPLKKYLALHPEAEVSAKDLRTIRNYLLSLSNPSRPNDTAKIHAYQTQLKLLQNGIEKKAIVESVNGIKYIPDYRNWEVLSISERFDNGTMRVIYGNDVALKAVRENNVHPWPDGSIMVKVAWTEVEGAQGIATPGEFRNFQYMIKDKVKYKDTEGWGFARFDGLDLKPFGEAGFDNSCINCHRAVSNNDFVFTRPFKR